MRSPLPTPDDIVDEIRAITPGADYVVDGQDAIREWLRKHGLTNVRGGPVSWRRLCNRQRDLGVPFAWHVRRPGSHHRQDVMSTHLVLLRWLLHHARDHYVPVTWRPSPSALRMRRLRDRRRRGAVVRPG